MIQQFTLVINVQILVRHFESDRTERLTIINFIYIYTQRYIQRHTVVLDVSNSFATPRTVACQAPLSMEFPRQEYRSWLPFPSPGNLADPGNEPASPALAGTFFTTEPPGKSPQRHMCTHISTHACTIYTYSRGYNL